MLPAAPQPQFACYFIDPEQIVQAVIHYPMYIGRSIGELLRVQRALIDTYQNDLSTPVDWQPSEARKCQLLMVKQYAVGELCERLISGNMLYHSSWLF